MSEYKTRDQLETELETVYAEIQEIVNNNHNSLNFYYAVDDLLQAQDRKTAAEIDCAACGRTESDRRRESNAKLAFAKQLLNFYQKYSPK